ncbi:MAG: ABC transporter ATP-binding protein [Bacteroidetes bacterium]|nr:ABC transporter ATP-binding protein [Bacteroidota bacterium]MCH8942030.1 ABC transporter ATP-binding protein [Bacteroidota bacterium]
MKTYFRILGYVKPYWRHVALSIICTMFYAGLNGLSIYLTIPLLDTLFQESARKEVVQQPVLMDKISFLPQWVIKVKDDISKEFKDVIMSGSKEDALLKICFLVLIAFIFKNISGYLQAYFLSYVEQGTIKDIRNSAYMHLHKLPMSYFKHEKIGNLISRITNDVNVVQASISVAFLNMIREPLTIIVFLGIAISISWKLTMLALVVLPFSMIIIAWIGLKLRKQSGIIQAKMADITTILQEVISGVKIVKAFGMEKYENNKFMKETNNFFKLMLRIVRVRNVSSPITEVLSTTVGVVIIYFGGLLVLKEQTLSASEFMGFLFAIFQLMPPIKELSSVNNRIQESSAAGDRIFEILDTPPIIADAEDAVEKNSFSELLKFDNVSFNYEDSNESVLKNINFEVQKGEILALVGPSGGGKSTLVDLIPRFYDPVQGSILLDNIDIRKIKIDSLRSLMGIVTQEIFLFNETVKKNIAYGLSDHPMNKIEDAAKMANAHDFILEMSNGYDTVIGERGVMLSGGQRQRISIARALFKDPEIMIFDEATSSLDTESESLVQEAIDRLMYNRTTIVIAHRLSTIRNATRILVIDNGEIIQRGTHSELISQEKGLYKKLYEMQFRD